MEAPDGALLPATGSWLIIEPSLIKSSYPSTLLGTNPLFTSVETASASVIPTTSGTSTPSTPALTVRITSVPEGITVPSLTLQRMTISLAYSLLSSYSMTGVSPTSTNAFLTASASCPTTSIILICFTSSCTSSSLLLPKSKTPSVLPTRNRIIAPIRMAATTASMVVSFSILGS